MSKNIVYSNNYNQEEWKIIIPKINLEANISEGTELDVLKRNVGHFKNTNKWNGKVGLAAHDSGFTCNYFEHLNELEIGDIIEYKNEGKVRIYEVSEIKVISELDWSSLNETQENTLTLITCIKNLREFRLCVIAKESRVDGG